MDGGGGAAALATAGRCSAATGARAKAELGKEAQGQSVSDAGHAMMSWQCRQRWTSSLFHASRCYPACQPYRSFSLSLALSSSESRDCEWQARYGTFLIKRRPLPCLTVDLIIPSPGTYPVLHIESAGNVPR